MPRRLPVPPTNAHDAMSSELPSDQLRHSDYHEKVNVTSAHEAAAAAREKPDPETGHEPMSLWAFFLCGLALVLGGSYFGSNASGFNMSQYTVANYVPSPPPMGLDTGPKRTPVEQWLYEGKKKYESLCQACHQPNGNGQAASGFPPLAKSEWVTGGTERLAMIILNGIKGPITVNGATYNNDSMQPWKSSLNDKELAQVMSYIRTSWGNTEFLPEDSNGLVNTEMAATARQLHADKEKHTVADLAGFNQDLPGGPVDPETIE